MANRQEQLNLIRENIASYPDFPKKGILFWDIFSVLQNPVLFHTLKDVLIQIAREITPPIECVSALDARGFLFGPLIALDLNIPFVPIRKKGKLPGEVLTVSYSKEYGEDTLELQLGSIKKGQRVLLVDDLLATGGSLACGCELIKKAGGDPATCLVIIELEDLKGRENIPHNIISLLKF
ncbi:unnamed protein product [Phaedon cochleariae]|uniref:Adenine phosphoribosyltransferase n=1 Tax=Phaedon cochleariae TaxID=80249 RepID=A0A9P0DT49_PHACE|nr:unnamed protein product [Phaedon cochleariae]